MMLDRNRVAATPRQRTVFGVALVIAPILIVLVLQLPLINQLNYADAWFYSAYAWAPKHHFSVFGWNYFSVRFPAIFAIGAFERVFGVGGGYLLLRYVLAVACGTSLYLCVRRIASPRVALAGALLLYVNPFFSRMLLWDYSGFIEVAGGVLGVSLWYWSDGRRAAWTVPAGVALACAVFANALIGTAVFVLLLVEASGAARDGLAALRSLACRVTVLAGCTVGVFVIGYLGYVAILGPLSPWDLVRPTVTFIGENDQQSSLYQHPVSTWLLREARIWAPILISVALAVVMRRRVVGRDLPARIAQLCIVYTAFLWLYRFTVTSSVVETWWAYSVVVVATAPATGLLISELSRGVPRQPRWATLAGAALGASVLLIRALPHAAASLYGELATHSGLMAGLLAVGAGAAMLAARGGASRGLSLTGLAVVLAVMFFAPSVLDGRGTTGVFVTSGSEEWNAYGAGKRLADLIRNYDSPRHRVFLWYPGTLGYVSIAWADLPQTADTLNEVGLSESVTGLTALGAARVRQPLVRYVLIMSPADSELQAARAALAAGGFGDVLVRSGGLAAKHLDYALVRTR